MFHPDDSTRMKWAEAARDVVRDILGLRKDAGFAQQRKEIMRKLRLRGMSQEAICKELDLNEDLKGDPLLEKWWKELMLKPWPFGYHAAFKHRVLKSRMKKHISTA